MSSSWHAVVALTLAPPSYVDILLEVHAMKGVATALMLHNDISQICELWWKQDRGQKELLAPQTISYLIIQVIHTQPFSLSLL